ncbi:hypothetical protein AJ80_00918 [Polytolypa hystricis UAMH7299]|uniref:Uncharacterized protein n=1 Tax=Polytolypa hystricis (strain UAMH7299) TaxID=1447883 RepID=A0A2B7Z216_POLH7|nr:hypothetical protein AJ80_00918 [Polytolypa hystricis UAMH7299]
MDATKIRHARPLVGMGSSTLSRTSRRCNWHRALLPTQAQQRPLKSKETGGLNSDTKEKRSSPARDTDKHIRSILNHPLFSVVPPKAYDSAHKEKMAKDPLGLLDELMASGKADAGVLIACLKSYLTLIKSTKPPPPLKPYSAASRIIAWYDAADAASRLDLVRQNKNLSFIMPYLIREGHQEAVMKWSRELYRRATEAQTNRKISDLMLPDQNKAHAQLLSCFIASEIAFGGGINTAISYFTRQRLLLPPDARQNVLHSTSPLRATAFRLIYWIVANSDNPQKDGKINEASFTNLLESSSHLSNRNVYWGARLLLHHPTQPDASAALQYLQRILPRGAKVWTPAHREHLLKLALETAQFCMDRKQYKHVSWLMAESRKLLPAEKMTTQGIVVESDPPVDADPLLSLCAQ